MNPAMPVAQRAILDTVRYRSNMAGYLGIYLLLACYCRDYRYILSFDPPWPDATYTRWYLEVVWQLALVKFPRLILVS